MASSSATVSSSVTGVTSGTSSSNATVAGLEHRIRDMVMVMARKGNFSIDHGHQLGGPSWHRLWVACATSMAGPNLLPQKLDRGELLGDDGRPEVDKYMKSRTGPHSVESLNPNDSNVNPLGRGMPPDLSKRKSVSMLVKAFQSLPEDKTAHAMTSAARTSRRRRAVR